MDMECKMQRDITPDDLCPRTATHPTSCAPADKEGAHDVSYNRNNTNNNEKRKTDNMSPTG